MRTTITAPKTAQEALPHISRVVYALSLAYADTLKRVITAPDAKAREQADGDQDRIMEALAAATAIELFLRNQAQGQG